MKRRMAIDWDADIEVASNTKAADLVRSDPPVASPPHSRGFERLERVESTAGAPARPDKHVRLERLRASLERRESLESPELRPDPAVAQEVVKGAETALDKVGDPTARYSFRERVGLEAVVLTDGTRPSLTVHDGFVDLSNPEIGDWDGPLKQFEQKIRRVIASVGRINIPSDPGFAGTCFVVAPGLVVTNRHVLEQIARQDPEGNWSLLWPENTTIDFNGEDGANAHTAYGIRSVRFTGPDPISRMVNFAHLDLALLAVEPQQNFPAAVELEKEPDVLSSGRNLFVVGFPGEPWVHVGAGTPRPGYETAAVMSSVFNSRFGVKKLAPGRVDVAPGKFASDKKAWIFSHDASTLAGNSGSAVVDLGTDGGRLVGLHFGGLAREENWAHALAKLQDRLQPYELRWV